MIIKRLKKKGKLKVSEIVKATGFTRAYVNRFFKELRDEGKVTLIGSANRAHYVLALRECVQNAKKNILDITLNLCNRNLNEDRVLANIKKKTGIFKNLRKNVSDILNYTFSEILNNAIEHSRSKTIKVNMARNADTVSFSVRDTGVGIFNNIMGKKRLRSVMEAIQDLLKGKQTTAPKLHSGEGIFFTSKATDILIIRGSDKKLIFDNLLDDVFIKDIKSINGTKVNFAMNTHSKKILLNIFKQYTDASFEFSRTDVTVRLYEKRAQCVSRSEARRIVSGLDKFKTVILDFKNVNSVGQSFADEIFRVWKTGHPGIAIEVKNANENVQFMINRTRNSLVKE